jgi:putative redox protein
MSAQEHHSRLVWRERMTFDATTTTGHSLVLDTSKQQDGDERGPRPVELVLTGLAGCTAMDVVSILKKKREPLEGLEVEVRGSRREEHPRIYTHIEVIYRVRGPVKRESAERAIELSEERYCSVSAMLRESAEITWRMEMI